MTQHSLPLLKSGIFAAVSPKPCAQASLDLDNMTHIFWAALTMSLQCLICGYQIKFQNSNSDISRAWKMIERLSHKKTCEIGWKYPNIQELLFRGQENSNVFQVEHLPTRINKQIIANTQTLQCGRLSITEGYWTLCKLGRECSSVLACNNKPPVHDDSSITLPPNAQYHAHLLCSHENQEYLLDKINAEQEVCLIQVVGL